MSDILVPKGQDQDRVQRRLEKYRNRHDESIPRFEHTLNGINEQQKQETLLLRQRFLEPKAKKSNKKNEKKSMQVPAESPTTTATTTTPGPKVTKRERQSDEIDLTDHQNQNVPENYEPPAKVAHCNGGPTPSPTFKKTTKGESSSGMTKFPPEILHQGKNGSNSKSKQNAKVSSAPTPTPVPYPVSNTLNIYLKQESKHVSAFADLDQCAAALEKDGATSMGLIEGSSDGLIPSDTLKDLISEISDLNPDFMGDFDFGEDRHPQSTNQASFPPHPHTLPVAPVTPSSFTSSPRQVKMEGGEYSNPGESTRGLSNCAGPSPAAASTASPLPHPSHTPPYASGIFETSSSPSGANHPSSGSSTPNPTYCPQTTTPPTGATKPIRIPYISPTGMGHDSPAAQTLKQMAQHHQHKQLEIAGNFKGQPPQSHPAPARSPFAGDSYSSFTGEFTPQGQPGFGNVRNHSGDGVMIKQENPGQGVYGACPPNLNFPTSPMDINAPGRRSKSPANVMGHSKSFTQAHLNLQQLPPSYRRSFSPPTSFNPSNQQVFTQQHKMNQSPAQMTLQQHQQGPGPGHQVPGPGQQMGMGIVQEAKGGGGLPTMVHHHHSTHYYQQNIPLDGNFSGGQHEQGQTINFTQQHLRMSQSGHPQQQQPMGRMMGVSPPAQQPPANQMDRSRLPPRLPLGGGVEMSGIGPRVPMEIQHRMMMRDGMGGAQGNEMIGRFNPGSSSGPGRPQHQQQVVVNRQQAMSNAGYHHQQVGPQHMAIPPRRLVPYQPPPQENRISNQNQHQDNWHHHHPTHQDHTRGFHQQQRPPNQQHFQQMGMTQQQQNLPFPQHHHLGHASYQQHQNLRMNHSRGDGKNGGSSSEEVGLVLKTEVESAEFNLDLLEGMGEEYFFDPSSNYQNILDSF